MSELSGVIARAAGGLRLRARLRIRGSSPACVRGDGAESSARSRCDSDLGQVSKHVAVPWYNMAAFVSHT